MALRNITSKVLQSFFELLDGNISVSVYRSDVPPTETGHYVVIRPESETGKFNNSSHVTQVVIITEVVSKFPSVIDDGVAPGIDDEIASLLYPTDPAHHNLPDRDDIQIVEVKRQNATYLSEDDGTFKYLRIITRNVCRVVQDDSEADEWEPGGPASGIKVYEAVLMTNEDNEIVAHVNNNTFGSPVAWAYEDGSGTFVNGILSGAFPQFKTQVYWTMPNSGTYGMSVGWSSVNGIGINIDAGPFGVQNMSIRIIVYP